MYTSKITVELDNMYSEAGEVNKLNRGWFTDLNGHEFGQLKKYLKMSQGARVAVILQGMKAQASQEDDHTT